MEINTAVTVRIWGMLIGGTVMEAGRTYAVVRLDDTRTWVTVSYDSIETA